jgi:hypothetical protein
VLGARALDVASGCGLEAMSLCSAVKGDAGADGERKWGNNGGRSVGGNEWVRRPFLLVGSGGVREERWPQGLLFGGEKFKQGGAAAG